MLTFCLAAEELPPASPPAPPFFDFSAASRSLDALLGVRLMVTTPVSESRRRTGKRVFLLPCASSSFAADVVDSATDNLMKRSVNEVNFVSRVSKMGKI